MSRDEQSTAGAVIAIAIVVLILAGGGAYYLAASRAQLRAVEAERVARGHAEEIRRAAADLAATPPIDGVARFEPTATVVGCEYGTLLVDRLQHWAFLDRAGGSLVASTTIPPPFVDGDGLKIQVGADTAKIAFSAMDPVRILDPSGETTPRLVRGAPSSLDAFTEILLRGEGVEELLRRMVGE